MKDTSSTTPAKFGSNSLIGVPDRPWRLNLKIDGAIGSLPWPDVIVVSRWPWRIDGGRS